MVKKIVLKGQKSWGRAEGEALVGKDLISWYSDIDIETGEFVNPHHDLYGRTTKNVILIFPGMKGGMGSNWRIPACVKDYKVGPLAIINVKSNMVETAGALLAGIPIIDRLDRNPIEVIETGDWVVVDGEKGIVEVTKKKHK